MALIRSAARPRSRLRALGARAAFAAGAVALAVALAACSNGGSSSSAATGASSAAATGKVGGSITVWVDSVRLPAAQAYVKAHPNVKVQDRHL